MRTIDLDAALAARTEAEAEPVTMVIAGESFAIPARSEDLTLAFLDLLSAGNNVGAVYELLGDQADRFRKLRPTLGMTIVMLQEVAELYGFGSPGESSASNGSSKSTSSRSRPTSLTSTG